MKKKNLILTYSTNQTELTSLTYPFLERYCENHNLDLLIMREQNQKIVNKCEIDGANWFVGCDRWYAYDLCRHKHNSRGQSRCETLRDKYLIFLAIPWYCLADLVSRDQ